MIDEVGKDIEKELLRIYSLMREANGHRNRWPAESPFEMMVGAIVTQFVTWSTVETAISNLKREHRLSIRGILDSEKEYLGELIVSTRFYKQKALKLIRFCQHLENRYQGNLTEFLSQELNILRNELLGLHGIGEETADCILLYAADKPIFVVDAYTVRIFSRLGYVKEGIRYGEMQKFFMVNLQPDVKLCNDYHAQWVFVGNRYCFKKKSNCVACPLQSVCRYGKVDGVE